MKGLVAYDTYYGNTKRVAEAILEQIRADGHDAELRNVKEAYPTPPRGDFLFVGSPNRMARVSGSTRRFVKKLNVDEWKGKPVAVFTTVAIMPKEDADEKQKRRAQKWILGAAIKLRDMARARGLDAVDKVLYAEVKDTKGPLVDDAIEKTKLFAHEVLLESKG